MALFFLKKTILAKIETSYGVDPTPTGVANAILARNVSITPLDAELHKRGPHAVPFFGDRGSIPGSASVKMEFEVEIAGSGAAGTAPAWDPLLRACAFSSTNNVGVSQVFNFVSGAFESLYIYFNLDGVLHKLAGVRSNVTLELNHNAIPVYKFSIIGNYVAPSDAALPTLTLTAWQKALPVNKVNTTFSLHGYSAIMSALSIDAGLAVDHKDYVNSTDQVRITNRETKGKVTIEAALIASKDWFALARAGTTGVLQVVHGTAAGYIVQLDGPAVQLGNPGYEDADGVTMLSMDLMFQPTSAGNNELTITSK